MRFSLGAVAHIHNRRQFRTCGYKHKHWTYQKAVSHRNSIYLRFGPRLSMPLTVYRCRHCGAFHVGRQRQTVGQRSYV